MTTDQDKKNPKPRNDQKEPKNKSEGQNGNSKGKNIEKKTYSNPDHHVNLIN